MTPARSRGQKVTLSDPADDPDLDDGRGPRALAPDGGGRSVRLDQLALNPLDSRRTAPAPGPPDCSIGRPQVPAGL